MSALHDVGFSLWQGMNCRKSAVYTVFATACPRILRLFITQPWRKSCFVQSSRIISNFPTLFNSDATIIGIIKKPTVV